MIDPPDAILETALYVDDLEGSAVFYGEIVGLDEVLRVKDRHIFYGCGHGMLLLFVAAATETSGGPLPVPVHGARGPGHMCFRVPGPAIDRWVKHLETAGIEIEADFEWPNGARSVYVRDPAGNSVEFSEPKLWNRQI